jgi:RNA polymerase sigma-70 factor (ECF subfamily)
MVTQPMYYRAMDDRDLVIAFKAGEPGAYDEMYRRYSARVSSICRRMLSNADDAQEAVQETFLKAYVALPQFNGRYKLGAWLSRIASNVCLDALRARARGATVITLHPESDLLGVESSAEEVVVGHAPEVTQNMSDIQPLHARALMMRGVEGLSHREMAGKLSMSPAQVKALLHRARRSFKRTWDEAKGWVVAPLVGLRSLTRQVRGASATSTQLAGAAAGVSPLLAERVAASAVIVAVALTGLPQTASSPSQQPGGFGKRPLQAIERTLPRERGAVRTKHAPSAPVRVAAAAPNAAAAAPVTEQSVVPALEKMLTKTNRAVTHHDSRHRDSGDDGVISALGSAARGTAKRVGKDVGELIPPP